MQTEAKKIEEERPRIGDTVEVRASWTTLRGGVVDSLDPTGFRIAADKRHLYPTWFGWGNLVRIVERAAPPAELDELEAP